MEALLTGANNMAVEIGRRPLADNGEVKVIAAPEENVAILLLVEGGRVLAVSLDKTDIDVVVNLLLAARNNLK